MLRARFAFVVIVPLMASFLGCKSLAHLIETSADIDRAGKLSNLLEVVVPFGEEACSD